MSPSTGSLATETTAANGERRTATGPLMNSSAFFFTKKYLNERPETMNKNKGDTFSFFFSLFLFFFSPLSLSQVFLLNFFRSIEMNCSC
jgi:hypothetical protein